MDEIGKDLIDIVITWVDGNDPNHQLKLEKALGGKSRNNIPGADFTRFGNVNELKYCLLSIFTFAPFIRKIFIITDQQDPDVAPYINKYFPNRINDIRIVDHQEIFRGYERYLPIFNSRAIESVMWRIEGLSNKFIYLNDDTFLVKDIKIEDWFIKDKPVMRGEWIILPYYRNIWNYFSKWFNKNLLSNPEFQPKPSYHIGQWNAAALLGFKWRYFFSSHTPHVMERKIIEKFFLENLEILEKQLSFKFRHNDQFNVASLNYHLQILSGNRNYAKPSFSFLHPFGRKEGYIERKFKKCENDPEMIYMNVQSLELCERRDQEKIICWMEKTMKL